MRITEAEEMELLEKYQKNGDMRAFKKLRISLRPLIKSTVRGGLPKGNDISEGQIAIRIDSQLPALLLKYNPNQGVKLNTFLINQIRSLVQNAVSENKLEAHVPRPEHGNLYRYQQAKRQAALEFGMNPTPEQILKIDPRLKNVAEVNRIAQYDTQTLIGDAKMGSDDSGYVDFKDQFGNYIDNSKEQKLGLQIEDLHRLKREFPLADQEIIDVHIFKEKSLVETALMLGVSSSRVRKVAKDWKEAVAKRNIF